MVRSSCDICMNYSYDDEYECFTCAAELDEDEMLGFITQSVKGCPYFRPGDEYTIVRKQI